MEVAAKAGLTVYIYLVKVANLAVECSMPYKQNVV